MNDIQKRTIIDLFKEYDEFSAFAKMCQLVDICQTVYNIITNEVKEISECYRIAMEEKTERGNVIWRYKNFTTSSGLIQAAFSRTRNIYWNAD